MYVHVLSFTYFCGQITKQIYHNLFRTLLLGTKAKTMLAKQPCCIQKKKKKKKKKYIDYVERWPFMVIFSSPGQSPGRAIALPPRVGVHIYVKFF